MTEPIITGLTPASPVKANMPYKVFRQGWLLKSPPRAVRKKLHRYWFVLFQQKDMLAFLYFQDEDHYLERKKNEGFFRIDECTSIDVVPEYLSRKNAFCIATPKVKYFLVSESRYELHHWLIALHDARNEYKNTMSQCSNDSKKSIKRRSHSVAALPNPSSSSKSKTYPRIKPTRPAPPAPPKTLKKKGDEENVPPSDSVSEATTNSTQDLPSPTTNQLDDIVAGLLLDSQQPSTLDYTLTEDEAPLINGHSSQEETESLSMSMPLLNDHDDKSVENRTEESTSDDDPATNHTRHFSFSDSYEFPGKNGGKKKSNRKRPGSIKGRRSVSPPNLPPPPPPPTDQETSLDYNGEQVINSFEQDYNQKGTTVSKSSPRPPPPQRTTSLHSNPSNRDSAVSDYLDEAFLQEDDQIELISQQGGKSPGILRKGEQHKSTKRTVVFDESNVKGRYEPRVDHESSASAIAKAKAKLFGETESSSFRYTRNQLQNYSNVEPQDELMEAIETALKPTSYMESKRSKVGFSVDIGPPSVPLPIRTHDGGGYTVETSPIETTNLITDWSNPTVDDLPTTSTFAPDQDTMYRSIV